MTGDDTLRLTYHELADMRGISLASARRLVHRHKWPKQVGNDGLSRIAVPAEFAVRVDTDATDDVTDDAPTDADDGATTVIINGASNGGGNDAAPLQVVDFDEAIAAFGKITTDAVNDVSKGAIMTLQDAILSLRLELFSQRERADKAEKRVEELQRAMDEQAAEHRRVVSELVSRIPERRSWWRWRR